ncbi:glycoside hydrolase 5 family protein [Actinocatenispora rupis]|uniref:Mannan endo-1,4-beta-mannosidase n=1 Tax=Actinocatenispora rupis TaxID=519421 RepID=A0A8J3JGR7_9ACTN|nr:beta-mannosidase [Actinocatenispora rupis]GID16092.1 mannan endo-1,4-beta-mannosidase [Actinocatenispora rupis]
MQRNSAMVTVDGQAVTWLGANFWSRTGGPLMWRNYDPAVVRDELRVLSEHGLRQTRSFFYWPDFHPEPDTVDEEKVAHFRDFLDAHTEYGMTSIPTFIVGHMSGENWDPAWRGGLSRDLYADVWLVSRQAWFVEQMVSRLHDHPAVAGWLISNEMPIYGRRRGQGVAPQSDVTSWSVLMVQAVRAGGGTQPVSLGDGAWGIEVTGDDNGFSVRETGKLVDFVGPHVYRMESDQIRQHLNAAFLCEMAAVANKPVVLEEFGLSTDFVSEPNQGHYYRQTLHNSLLAGATGWIAWNNTDYDHLNTQDPYRHHPFEMHFGITTNTGEPKAPLRELDAFAKVLSTVDFTNTRRADTDAALVVTSYLERDYPISTAADRSLVFHSLRQGYVAAREASLPVGFTREEDGIVTDAKLYLLPSTRQILAPTWIQLHDLAESGAVVYLSYCSGEHAFHRGPWFQKLDDMFGVEHQLAYGLTNPIADDVVEFTFQEDFGSIRSGEVLRFAVAGNENSRAFLPVEARGAKVVATDQHGNPALLRNAVGSGETILCTYPLEHMAAVSARVNPEQTYRIYDALAAVAGVERTVTVDDPRVFTDTLVHTDGSRFVWFVSQHDTEATVTPSTTGTLRPLGGGEPVTTVTLPAYGVGVFELEV